MLPLPLMMPVMVPRDLLLPAMLGCSLKSAATAEVKMLLGPPMRIPMQQRMTIIAHMGSPSLVTAKSQRRGTRRHWKQAMTQARRPPKMSETFPTMIPATRSEATS